MKLDQARIDSHLANPASPITLIYGPDAGLVSERGLAMVRAVPGAAKDPFRFAELQDPSPDTFLAEATAASLTGGRRVVRVRAAGEDLAKPLESLLKSGVDALLILEAGELTPKSKLRALAEKSAAIAAIACYGIDPARLPQLLNGRLRALGLSIEPDAANWVAANIAPEEGPLAQAIELLRLYAGSQTKLALADVSAALADGGESSIGDAVDAALLGDAAATDRALSLAFDEGVSPVGIIRVLLTELMRLRLAAAAIAAGAPISAAVGAMRPPVFFKRQPTVTRMLQRWKLPQLTAALSTALAAERAVKQTLTPDQPFCRQLLLTLAAQK